ncbi:SWIM zinc finger family protein [Streptomyces sp. NPDC014344]|uniref:SWIM zinc finger family protein n=1 Tax=Streptomyces sp. NPDC014344 TaxID=3364871 RepID=UPI0036F8F290
MTSRPSEQVREALRAARERGSGGAEAPSGGAEALSGGAEAPEEPAAPAAPAEEAAQDGPPSPAGRTPRPSDAAREALRRTLRARRETSAAPAGADVGRPRAASDTAAGGVAGGGPRHAEQARSGEDEGAWHGEGTPAGTGDRPPYAREAPSGDAAGEAPSSVSEVQPAVGEAPGTAPPRAEEGPADAADAAAPVSDGTLTSAPRPDALPRSEGATGDDDAPAATPGDAAGHASTGDAADPAGRAPAAAPGGHEASGSTDDTESHPASRPGDIAREALRAAREERARARAREQVEAAKRPRRDPAPRVPRTTRGDRAADRRAREIRETLADAFRMPDTADDATPAASADVNARPVSTPRRGPDTGGPATPVSQEPVPARGGGPAVPDGGPASTVDPGPAPAASPGPDDAAGRAAPPVTPRSMAAPARDGDHRRTFPPFPPRSSGGDGEAFAETWWGRAWVTALEDGALDPARLARGRGYAERGHVDAITVTPGLVLAYVQGSRPRPYRVQVRLRTFDDADWERFLDTAADRPGHIAALLDKEMPQSLADCGVPLLPGPGDLAPRCSCPDSGHPCKHAAALCYQTARLLDADPFVLLLLRGRGEREVIDALSRLSAARAARAVQGREPEPLPGMRAADAVSRRGPELPPLPAPLPPPQHPEQPPAYPESPGGPDPFALDQLATDAAARAHALLTTGRDPVGPLTLWHDAVRLAAARPGSGLTAGTRALYASLARAAGRTPGDLARAVAAWRQGGPTGLAVLEEPWDPPAGRFDRARPLLLAADLPAFRPWRNRLTHPRGHVQLRLGRDHLWYAYESEPGQDDWWPRGTPDPDPVGALTGLDTFGDV